VKIKNLLNCCLVIKNETFNGVFLPDFCQIKALKLAVNYPSGVQILQNK
jgi:hypothetical protein